MPSLLRHLAPFVLLLAAAPAPPLQAGQWEETLVFALQTVNGSPDLAARMAGALPSRPPHRECLSAADAADPRGLLLDAGDGRCRFSRFAMADGRIAAVGTCAGPGGQDMAVEGTGTYTATAYDFAFTGTGHAGGLEMAFRGRDSGRRQGACPAAAS